MFEYVQRYDGYPHFARFFLHSLESLRTITTPSVRIMDLYIHDKELAFPLFLFHHIPEAAHLGTCVGFLYW